ncbi:hypothetical protein D3C87_1348600 [compost metagenome]
MSIQKAPPNANRPIIPPIRPPHTVFWLTQPILKRMRSLMASSESPSATSTTRIAYRAPQSVGTCQPCSDASHRA